MNELAPQRHRTLSRVIIWVVIVSFSLAALAGIAVLLGAEMNDTSAKVLATTVIVGGYALAALSGLGLLGRRIAWFGFITIGVAVAGLVYTLWLLWADIFDKAWQLGWNHVWEWLGTVITVTVFCSAAARLLMLVDRKHNIVRVGMTIALTLLTFSALIVVNLIWQFTDSTSERFRLYGIVWILTALAVIVTPILGVVLRPKPLSAEPPADAQPPPILSQASIDRLLCESLSRGLAPDELVTQLLDGVGEPDRA